MTEKQDGGCDYPYSVGSNTADYSNVTDYFAFSLIIIFYYMQYPYRYLKGKQRSMEKQKQQVRKQTAENGF